MGIKSFIKRYNIIYKPASWIRSIILNSVKQIRVFSVSVRRGTLFSSMTTNFISKKWGGQSFLEYPISVPHLENENDLVQFLKDSDIQINEGRWTVYVPPQEELERLFPFITEKYPRNAGLKILKSFGHPESVKYISQSYQSHPYHPFLKGDMRQFIRVANHLYYIGIGPRLYDVIAMKTDTQTLTSFVIQHIDSDGLNDNDYVNFMAQLREIISQEVVVPMIQSWENHKDFSLPDCNENLIRSNTDGKLYYIDFQSFIFKSEKKYLKNIVKQHKNTLHFGTEAALLGGKFLYQSIPGIDHGRRDTERRWKIFLELLEKVGEDLHDKVVFDICCNAGMVLYNCLVNGAYWGVGWDLPVVAEVAVSLQSALGITRLDVFGEEITDNTDFMKYLPPHLSSHKDCILFYLAAKKHIGFPEGVGKLPWTTMIYEGHGDEDFAKTREFFAKVSWLKDAKIGAMTTNKSELGVVRTIAIITREYKS